jgi:RNA polymerase sigma-70 factor (sigma-E family)
VTFDEFVNAELDGLISFSAALAGDLHLAEDILSDALVKVAVQWRRVAAADNPAAYVRRVVVTTYLADRRKARRRRTEPTSDMSVLDRATPDHIDAVLAREEVIALLARLPPQQKAVIVLRYLLDEPDDQIALALGCTPGTVRSHLSLARAALRLAVTSPASPAPAAPASAAGRAGRE